MGYSIPLSDILCLIPLSDINLERVVVHFVTRRYSASPELVLFGDMCGFVFTVGIGIFNHCTPKKKLNLCAQRAMLHF